MKIYTKSGDDGTTSLRSGERVEKNVPIIETEGTLDELNALLGIILSMHPVAKTKKLLTTIQNDLFVIGSLIATTAKEQKSPALNPQSTQLLEKTIDEIQAELEPLQNFILPGGTPIAAQIHLARTVCRRAERAIVKITAKKQPKILSYINRLSDLLFVLARYENAQSNTPETKWIPE